MTALLKPVSRRKAYAKFKAEFSTLCADLGGTYSEHDTLWGGATFLFTTKLGVLRASIYCPTNWRREEIVPGSIYMRWHNYTGPSEGLGRGDFNRHSFKWNIHFSGEPEASRQQALTELHKRISGLR